MSCIEEMKEIRHTLIEAVEAQLTDLDKVCTKEMSEVVDMIKDLSEAIYHAEVVEAMEKGQTVAHTTINQTA